MWIVPRADLTEDQLSAVQMSFDKNQVIIGGPGSGKTLVLAHRTQQALTRPGVKHDRVKMLVYTKVLAAYLAEGLSDLGLPADATSTFDSWCLKLYRKHVGGAIPLAKSGPDFDAIREGVVRAVEKAGHPPSYDVLVVDEGQDLTPAAVKILRLMAKHVTLALDSRQQLYDGIDVDEACAALGVPRAGSSLLSAYRCTPLIVDVAAEFLPTDQLAAEFRAANLLALDGIETPVLFEATDAREEMNELALRLGERAVLGETTAVLVPTKVDEERYVDGLLARGLDVATRTTLSFGDLRPIVMTYHSAKGLTVDSVFLPGLVGSAFSALETEQRDRLLFVGISRAVRWLWVGTLLGDSNDALDRIGDLERRKSIRRLSGSHGAVPVPTSDEPAAPAAFDPADLL